MPKKKQQKQLTVENLRHTEYYGLQKDFDNLYAKSKDGKIFTNLMDLILSRDNILLAYRNIKTNEGSSTSGTDKFTISDIGKLSADEVVEKIRFIVKGSRHGYRPKPIRRVDIPKEHDPAKTRPLGIPCIWDRMVQQCIKQVMEPICEAKFNENSFGFRPNRSAEHAIQRAEFRLQNCNLHHVIEFDIKSFFDEVNHSKLIKQIWAMGIRDKHLIWVIKQILKAPIKMPDGSMISPTKGTPQGGLVSPLLANIVLNELDYWIESQWESNPVTRKYKMGINKNGSEIKSAGYKAMRNTQLKEMYIVRYADDFRIFCRTRDSAEKTKVAVTQWLSERLKLEVSKEKTKIVNVKRRYTDFLGFKIKVHPKGKTGKGSPKLVVKSHISDKNLDKMRKKLIEQAKRIAKPHDGISEKDEINRYNSMVMGMQNYYQIATNVNSDCSSLNRAVMTVLTNRLKSKGNGSRLVKQGRVLTKTEKERYGKSKMMRYVKGSNEPIYPIGFIQHKIPIANKRDACSFTPEGREVLHKNLAINTFLMYQMMKQPLIGRNAEYADNRISLFSAQWGKCSVTGREFTILEDIHCHHKIPKGKKGGTDKYRNLTLVLSSVHRLIHATKQHTIYKYLNILNLTKPQFAKVNSLRKKAGVAEIEMTTQAA